MSWDRVSKDAASKLLRLDGAVGDDLPPDMKAHWRGVAEAQLRGAVALHNRLAERHLAWLADEVGMGKTFVALAVAALVRHQRPDARILFLLPTSRLQPKWQAELSRFTRSCVRFVDHRARTFQDRPARPQVMPRNLRALGAALVLDSDRDVLANLGAFSLSLSNDGPGPWLDAWTRLSDLSTKLPRKLDRRFYTRDGELDKGLFKRVYAAALNTILPTFDLVICDESHNLRRGVHGGAARNQTLAAALGGLWTDDIDLPWEPPRPRVRRLLCLTATPVEYSFTELGRQAEVFGLLRHPDVPESTKAHMRTLLTSGSGHGEDAKKEAARPFIIRRLHGLHAATEAGETETHTKNMYRREWRQGGVDQHDERLSMASDRERLLVALVQKKVMEALHAAGSGSRQDFLPSFQMGMLSSFESFGETIAKKTRSSQVDEEDSTDGAVFDGVDQTRVDSESRGLDTDVVNELSRSYRRHFGKAPPHPKMDAVAAQVATWAWQGEKSLVFVRRVRTTEELADKISDLMSEQLIERLTGELDGPVRSEFERSVAAYRESRRSQVHVRPLAEAGDKASEDANVAGAPSFFAWFFRGIGDGDFRLGGHLRRQTLQDTKHPWALAFHDNHVLWLFGDDAQALTAWVEQHEAALDAASKHYINVQEPGPVHEFEARQAAALELLMKEQTPCGSVAGWLRRNLYPVRHSQQHDLTFEPAARTLCVRPFFARLRSRAELVHALWPGASLDEVLGQADVPDALREREVRRELLTTALRIGLSWMDVWSSMVHAAGGLRVTAGHGSELGIGTWLEDLLARLDMQRTRSESPWRAWHELSELAAHHTLLVGLNLGEVHEKPLPRLRKHLSTQLSTQAPAVALHGGSKSEQALRLFRMPGYPMVIVATDVVQEGVDLHTFCKRVLHYGISCSSSATEQRTGRVDRLGSLVHRTYRPSDEESMLQVHYPHLQDTVEPLQLAQLYRRIDRFLRMVHDNLGGLDEEPTTVALDDALGRDLAYVTPFRDRLESAYGVREDDLDGGTLAETRRDLAIRPEALEEALRRALPPGTHIDTLGGQRRWQVEVHVDVDQGTLASNSHADSARRQPIELQLRAGRDGSGEIVRFRSPVGTVDIHSWQRARALLTDDHATPGVCLAADFESDGSPGRGALKRQSECFVELRSDLPLWPGIDLDSVLPDLLCRVALEADRLERRWIGDGDDLSLEDARKRGRSWSPTVERGG